MATSLRTRIGHGASYARYLGRRAVGRLPKPDCDLVFVMPQQGARGWILEAICREIERYFQGTCLYADKWPLPPARAYYFAHYSSFVWALKHHPFMWGANRIVQFTHPRDLAVCHNELVYMLQQATAVISMCSLFADDLVREGVSRERMHVEIMGADPALFQPHQRGSGRVGFCSAFYPRKDPERILDIVHAMPHRQFALMGRNWAQWDRFHELTALPNFQYTEGPYSEYPAFYSSLDVFVSPSRLEGGPIPLLEAMMSNVVPVASQTGFAPDVIRPGENGFLFDVDVPTEEICRLIDQAAVSQARIRNSVEHLTWQRFSKAIQSFI